MKEIKFTENGGFPLEQETFARLQTSYKDELYSMLKQHMGIKDTLNYIISQPTPTSQGWLAIQGKLIAVPEGSVITSFIKITETKTALRFGDGVYRQVYTDYAAEYIDAIPAGIPDPAGVGVIDTQVLQPNARVFRYYNLVDFETVGFLPIDGSKPMEGDLNLGGNQLSNLDTNPNFTANVRSADFTLGYPERRGLLHPDDYLGRALVDQSTAAVTKLHVNYNSDWEETAISGKLELPDYSITTSSDQKIPLVVDSQGKVFRGNPYESIPIGLIALWYNKDGSDKNGEPPAGWVYCNGGTANGGTLEVPDLNTNNTLLNTVNYIIYVGLDAPSLSVGDDLEFTLADNQTTYSTPISLTATIENLTLVGWSQDASQTIPVIETPNGLVTNISGDLPVGEYTFTFTAEDSSGNQYSDNIVIKIKESNLAPVFESVHNGLTDVTNSSDLNIVTGVLEYNERSTNKILLRVGVSDPDGDIFSPDANVTCTVVHSNGSETAIAPVDPSLVFQDPTSGIKYYNFKMSPLFLVDDVIRFKAIDEDGAESIKEYNVFYSLEPSITVSPSVDASLVGNTVTKIFNVMVQGEANTTVNLKSEFLSSNYIQANDIVIYNYDNQNSIVNLTPLAGSNVNFGVELSSTGIRTFQIRKEMLIPNPNTINQDTSFSLSSKLSLVSNPNNSEIVTLSYTYNGGDGSFCFDVDSYVSLATGGSKKLKNIQIGDKLVAVDFPNRVDESSGDYFKWQGKLTESKPAEVEVTSKNIYTAPNYYELILDDGKVIKVTGEHPLLISKDGEVAKWVRVKNLDSSMSLIDRNGKAKPIQAINFKEEELQVALLDVESIDNYIISGIVAHNRKVENDQFIIIDDNINDGF